MKGRGRKKAPEVTAHSPCRSEEQHRDKKKTRRRVATFQTRGWREGRKESCTSTPPTPPLPPPPRGGPGKAAPYPALSGAAVCIHEPQPSRSPARRAEAGSMGGGGGPAIVSPLVLSAPHFHQFSQAVPPRLVQTQTLPPGCLPTTAPSLKINPSLCTTCLSLLPSPLSLPRGDSSANPVASPRIQTKEGRGRGSPCPHRRPPRWPFLGFPYEEAARLSHQPRFSLTLPSETRPKPLRLRLPGD